ncbi:nitroreductase family protein [Mycobacterium sp. IS-1742]|uniref:nitroreductase family protein n=1 Tax=Mycobacterium sp. IS-1742 TaxID=1772285 RepID=UPI0018D2240F|nr:nitroreductase family protein [Mycobacterium sp. IS-1742]
MIGGDNRLYTAKRLISTRVKRALPERALLAMISVRYRMTLRSEFRTDRLRYGRHCLPGETSGSRVEPRNLEAQLIKDYHRIEKGLALPEPKRPFGVAVTNRLEGNVRVGREAGTADLVLTSAETAQEALHHWNVHGHISDDVAPVVKAGDRGISNADRFFRSRHSVRDFESAEVPDDVLFNAVALALQSPSVCNRQAWLIRFYRDGDVSRVLRHQNGNRGFSHVVPVVGLITVDTRLFSAPGERNQPWIEGGIFSMSLVWALHALGLDSCMLNMSVPNRQSDALREEFGLADSELIIMMIAIGYARPGYRVARSPRRQLEEVVVRI